MDKGSLKAIVKVATSLGWEGKKVMGRMKGDITAYTFSNKDGWTFLAVFKGGELLYADQ